MTGLGVVFRPQLPPEGLLPAAIAAEEAGLGQLWLWEDCFNEAGIATAAMALTATRRLRVGIGLMPVPFRNVAISAMELATLERAFPGRLLPGLGHGVQEWMGQIGARVASPLTLLREYTVALSALLAGETVSTDGRYVHLDDVKLQWPPSDPPPVLIGVVKDKTLALAAEVGDGVILTAGTTPARVAEVRAALPPGRRVVVYVAAAFGPDAEARMDAEQQRWKEDWTDAVAVGSVPDVVTTLRAYVEAGADDVVLQPCLDEPDLAAYITRTATEVGPLLG